jgi:hypothetical protein
MRKLLHAIWGTLKRDEDFNGDRFFHRAAKPLDREQSIYVLGTFRRRTRANLLASSSPASVMRRRRATPATSQDPLGLVRRLPARGRISTHASA